MVAEKRVFGPTRGLPAVYVSQLNLYVFLKMSITRDDIEHRRHEGMNASSSTYLRGYTMET